MTDVISAVGEEILWLGRPVRGLLFDMDGTLAHTREAHGDVWAEWAAGKGISISRDQYLTEIYGRSNFDILPKVLPELAGDREAIRTLTAEKEDLFRRMVVAG